MGAMSEHAHGLARCACCSQAIPGQQNLNELAFLKSACAAAQQGNISKLQRILHDHPTAVADDGVGGVGAAQLVMHVAAPSPLLPTAC